MKVCWRIEANNTVTVFAGTYHGDPGVYGGVIIDGIEHPFTLSLPQLPSDVTGCQADCANYPNPHQSILKWQTTNISLPFGTHTVTTTATSAVEAPWPSCYPTSFAFGGKVATTLTNVGATTSHYSVPVTVSARLSPVDVGAPVVFSLDNTETCTGTVNAAGVASCSIRPLEAAGTYSLTMSYAGDAGHLASSDTVPFVVTKLPMTLTNTGATTSHYSVAATVAARLAPAVSGALHPTAPGATIELTLNGTETCADGVDAAGNAACSIRPMEAAGTYPLTAVYAGDARHQPASVTVPFVVTRLPTVMTYTGATTSDYHDPAAVSARLTTAPGALFPTAPGATVAFALDSADTCADVVDAAGAAACSITPQQPAGVYPLTASYAGDDRHLPSAATIQFTVTHEETTLTYTGETFVANAEPAVLSAVLREEGLWPIAGRTVSLTLGEGATAQSCTGVTDASGAASCVIASVDQPLDDTATVPIAAVFAGDPYYLPSADAAEALLQYMTGDAYALAGSAHLLLGDLVIGRTPYAGYVRTAHASTTTTPCVASLSAKLLGSEVVSAKLLCANVTTDLAPGSSTSTASVASATVALGIVPAIRLTAIQARSQSGCDGAAGQTTIGGLSIGGVNIPIGLGPNFTVPLPLGGRITINEQEPIEGDDVSHGLAVRGVHIVVPPVLGLAGVDLVFASATSAIHNCRPDEPLFFARGAGDDGDGDDGDGDGGDADAMAGGCQSSRRSGAIWLVAIALVAVRVRRRRR